MIESRVDKARELFKSGFNCSQAVFSAYADLFGMDFETAVRVSVGLGGGVGRLRETCGAVTGMAMLAGLKYADAENNTPQSKQKTYEIVREMVDEFKKTNRSVVCRELLGLTQAEKSTKPDERNGEYYSKRPCAEIVADAARAVEKVLLGD